MKSLLFVSLTSLLVTFSSSDYKSLYYEGYALYGKGRPQDAIVKFEQAYVLQKQSKIAFYLAYCNFQVNSWNKALQYAQDALTDQPALSSYGQGYVLDCEAIIKIVNGHDITRDYDQYFYEQTASGTLSVSDVHSHDLDQIHAQHEANKRKEDALLNLPRESKIQIIKGYINSTRDIPLTLKEHSVTTEGPISILGNGRLQQINDLSSKLGISLSMDEQQSILEDIPTIVNDNLTRDFKFPVDSL